ncbi:uncharacterized protein LOC117219948 isoform X1 [Megalopta genalis]|uniref:uncharacterized protein LOC117219948 isoform X1 n=1 Tax=Megalopta genalis TaxID=115081 RepID=UPI003FD0C653
MEKRMTKIIVAVLLVTFALNSFCTEISSQINLRPMEGDRYIGVLEPKNVVDFNKITGRSEFSYLHEELREQTNNMERENSKRLSDIINNIQITINGKEIKPSLDGCPNSICKVSMSSTYDDEGNVITDLHLRIITKSEADTKVNEIPVVDGVRGVEDSHDHPVVASRPTTYLHNNIPQIQTRYQDGEPWYQGRRTFQRPQIMWRYQVPVQFSGRQFPQYGGRPAAAPVVDDKIEPPLSKTQGRNK